MISISQLFWGSFPSAPLWLFGPISYKKNRFFNRRKTVFSYSLQVLNSRFGVMLFHASQDISSNKDYTFFSISNHVTHLSQSLADPHSTKRIDPPATEVAEFGGGLHTNGFSLSQARWDESWVVVILTSLQLSSFSFF